MDSEAISRCLSGARFQSGVLPKVLFFMECADLSDSNTDIWKNSALEEDMGIPFMLIQNLYSLRNSQIA